MRELICKSNLLPELKIKGVLAGATRPDAAPAPVHSSTARKACCWSLIYIGYVLNCNNLPFFLLAKLPTG